MIPGPRNLFSVFEIADGTALCLDMCSVTSLGKISLFGRFFSCKKVAFGNLHSILDTYEGVETQDKLPKAKKCGKNGFLSGDFSVRLFLLKLY